MMELVPESALFVAPVKHSVTISGHQTSISLEPVFWNALRGAAQEEGVALNALIGRIDELRLAAMRSGDGGSAHLVPSNLASAIRCWLWQRYCGAGSGVISRQVESPAGSEITTLTR